MPKFLVDESIGTKAAEILRQLKYDTIAIADEMRGAPDNSVLLRALQEGRVLVTNDKELASMALSHKIVGVLLLRLEDERAENRTKVLRRVLSEYALRMEGSIIIASERRIRIRPI